MIKRALPVIIFLILIVLGFILSWYTYNDIAASRARVEKTFQTYKSEYDKRIEYVFNLVGSIYFTIEPEQQALRDIVSARAEWETLEKLNTFSERFQAIRKSEELLDKGFSRILESLQSVKGLEKNQEYQDLLAKKDSLETAMAQSRDAFTDSVKTYNSKVSSFLGTYIAKLFGFQLLQ